MSIICNINGAWRTVSKSYVNIDGVWRTNQSSGNVDGIWRVSSTSSAGIDATRVASIDFVVWQTRFDKNNTSNSSASYSITNSTPNVLFASARKYNETSSMTLWVEGWAVPVLVLTDNSRVVMAGSDIDENVTYTGINAKGATVSQNSGINISASWAMTLTPSSYDINKYNYGQKCTYIDGIFAPDNNSFMKSSAGATTTRSLLTGKRSIYYAAARTQSSGAGNVSIYGSSARTYINSITNTFTGASIPHTRSVASGIITSKTGSGGSVYITYTNF